MISARYAVAAVIVYNNEEDRRYRLGSAASRRKARRLGYREGARHIPHHSAAFMELEILDTVTGERVRASGAETEAWKRSQRLRTAAEIGCW